jgi:PAS domain S-box-containing protein
MLSEQARQLFAGMPFSAVATLINGVLLVAVLWPVAAQPVLVGWLGALAIVTLTRVALMVVWRRHPGKLVVTRWLQAFTAGTLVAGLIWGSAAILLFVPDSLSHQVFLAFVFAGMSAGAVSSLSVYRPAVAAFLLLVLLPLAVRFLWQGEAISLAMGVMILLFLGVTAASARRLHDALAGNIRMREEIAAREEALNRFKRTLDQTHDCVFMFDPESLRFFYVNQGACEQVGYSQDELLVMHPYDIKPGFPEPQFRALIAPLLRGETDSLGFETEHQHRDGHRVPVEILLQYVAPAGEPPRFVAIVRDITERHRVDRLKNEFISTISHELRTPLTSIRGAIGLLGGDAVGKLPEAVRELLAIADRNSERLMRLINDILDIDKIESGRMRFDMHEHLLVSLVEQAIYVSETAARQAGVTIDFGGSRDAFRVSVDADRFQQVLVNLLSNAIKFSPSGEHVQVSVAKSGADVRIAVADRGPGVPLSFRPRLFQKFAQADATDARQKGGTGLGLSIARAISGRMNGRLDYEERPGGGSIFHVTFPVAATQAAASGISGYSPVSG